MSKVLYIDEFEYSTDQLAQAAWVTDASGLELDYMEYATDGAAQAAYVTSSSPGEAIAESHEGGTVSAEEIYGAVGNREKVAQSFQLSENITCLKVSVYCAKVASPTDNTVVRIETDSSGLPSGTLVHANATKSIASSTISTTKGFVVFAFDNTFNLSLGTTYWIVVSRSGARDTTNYIRVYANTGEYTNGVGKTMNTSVWGDLLGDPTADMGFRVYKVSLPALQCYSEDTIKQQGSYSLKVVAAQTGSLNETLTKSGLSIDLSGRNILKLDCYASRTGTNIQIQLHDSGGTTSTKDIVISSADTWTEITWDISGIADVDKDNIDQIIIKIINADSDNTFYVDNFRAEESLQCYSEDTIKVQGDYSLKVLAVQVDSLNKTLTKTLTDYLDYSIQDVIKFDIRASRTGINIQLQIHDVGGVTSSHNINIASANVWQTETWDISAITGTDRDAIDKIIIKIIDATTSNTIYVDNLYSKVIVESAHVFIGG